MSLSFSGAIDSWFLFSVALANLGIGLFVFLGKPRDPIRQAFITLVFGGFLWIAGLVELSLTHRFLFDTVINYGSLLLFLGGTAFVLRFPTPFRLPIPWWLLYAPLAIGSIFIIPEHLIVSHIKLLPSGGFVPVAGPLLPLWSLVLLCYALLAVGVLTLRYRATQGTQRQQLKYLILGMSTFFLSVVVFDAILPGMNITSLNGIGPLSSILFIGATAYAIVRHQLMDIRIIIQRGLVYSVLLGSIVALYLIVLSGIEALFGTASEGGVFASAMLTTIAGIFGAPIIERFFQRVTDRVFFKEKYDYPEALESLSRTLYDQLAFTDLTRAAEDELVSLLRTAYARIHLFEGKHEGCPMPTEGLCVPILVAGKEIGRIELGPKRSGDPYTPEDRRLLSTFAYQAATALSRARLYEEVQRHALELEKKVAQRTGELERLRTRERQTMIDLSHGLQTPLTVLSTKLEQAGRFIIQDGERQSLAQSVAEVSGFVYDLLSLANLERSMEEEERTRFSLTDLLKEVAEEITIIAGARHITVDTSIAPDLYFVGNEKRLREALMNLASNAVKYMGTGPHHGVIRFSLKQNGRLVELSVEDSGVGIAPEELQHIFDRFYRAQNQTYGAVPGTGLGLAITKAIVDQEDGSIDVESKVGRGTRFTILLHRAP